MTWSVGHLKFIPCLYIFCSFVFVFVFLFIFFLCMCLFFVVFFSKAKAFTTLLRNEQYQEPNVFIIYYLNQLAQFCTLILNNSVYKKKYRSRQNKSFTIIQTSLSSTSYLGYTEPNKIIISMLLWSATGSVGRHIARTHIS